MFEFSFIKIACTIDLIDKTIGHFARVLWSIDIMLALICITLGL